MSQKKVCRVSFFLPFARDSRVVTHIKRTNIYKYELIFIEIHIYIINGENVVPLHSVEARKFAYFIFSSKKIVKIFGRGSYNLSLIKYINEI